MARTGLLTVVVMSLPIVRTLVGLSPLALELNYTAYAADDVVVGYYYYPLCFYCKVFRNSISVILSARCC